MREIIGKVRAAIDRYQMISDNDKIAVGLSGGKDSLALLYSLNEIKRYYPKKFEIIAITLDPCFYGKTSDFSSVTEVCNEMKIKHVIETCNIWEIVFKIRNEKNPCSLCSKIRRGTLHRICIDEGCSKIALGHHMDDAAETFFLNLFHGGKIQCFSPVSYLSRNDLYMIRPMIFCTEKETKRICINHNLKICKSLCPVDGNTERNNINDIILNLERNYPSLRKKLIKSLQYANINRW